MDVEAADQTILFAGALDDPWVGLIVASITNVAAVRTVDVKGPIPVRLSGDDERLRTVIIHRSRLSQIDLSRIEGYRQENRSKLNLEIILCYSPYVRYAELERCSQAVNLLIPEASAFDILPLHLGRNLDRSAATPDLSHRKSTQVEVITTNHALRATLLEICLGAGFGALDSSDSAFTLHSLRSSRARAGAVLSRNDWRHPVVTLWDVPVLEAGWPELIEHRSRLGPVIAMLGFADRATVGLARARGAAACLDLPFNVVDLVDVLDRVSRTLLDEREPPAPARLESPHIVPAPHLSRSGKIGGRHRGVDAHAPSVATSGPCKALQPADPEAWTVPAAVARGRNDV
jgi:hypothetical protein